MDGSTKYNVIKLLENGRFGPVTLVQCTTSMKKFVMKEINLEGASLQEQKSAFLEASLLATLRHPNIVSYVEAYHQSSGRLYILMGYCEGGDLYHYIRRRNGHYFKEDQIVHWLVQICLALKHLHDNKILHRDLKTKNIFLTRSGIIKVGDLGIARVLKSRSDMATTVIGTPCYMSPEIFCNKPYSYKSDVWALGCCIYEIATLEQAFNALDLFSLMQNVLQGNVSVVPEHYSSDFVILISSFLAHDPEERPSVGDILLNVYIRKHITDYLNKNRNNALHKNMKAKKIDSSQGKTQRIGGTNKTLTSDSCAAHEKCPIQKRLFENNKIELSEYEPNFSSSVSLNSVVTTPDINGNGDGNDNSQRAHALEIDSNCGKVMACKNVEVVKIHLNYQSPNYCCSAKEFLSSGNNSKENISPENRQSIFLLNHSGIAQSTNHFFSRRNTPKLLPKKPNTSMSVPKTPRNNGEISLDFLSNLNNAVKQARSADNCCSMPNFRTAFSTKLCLNSPSLPNLRESCCLCNVMQKRRQLYQEPRPPYGNVRQKESCVCCDPWHRPAVVKSADSFKNSKDQESLPLLPVSDKNNVVLPKASEILFPKGNVLASGASSSDANIDKCLLKEIVTCNKNGLTNFAARQRRREKMSQYTKSTVTKSAPASVETFPAI